MATSEQEQRPQSPPSLGPSLAPAAPDAETADVPPTAEVARTGVESGPEDPPAVEAVAVELKSLNLDKERGVAARKEGSPDEEGEASSEEEKARFPFYPQRPNKADCAFYLKTGKCAFEKNCKFNHPVARNKNQVQVQSQESFVSDQASLACYMIKRDDESFDRVEQPQCKYHLTPGGCKYGSACRYGHSQEKIEAEQVELNFLGLPVRLGERECPYYMRTGSCKFASNCRFHHPDPNPTASNGTNPQMEYNGSDGSHPHPLGTSQPPMAQWALSRCSNEPASLRGITAPYMPHMLGPLPAVPVNTIWNSYQHPASPSFAPGRRTYDPSAATANDAPRCPPSYRYQQQKQSAEFPQRPGQPNCSYYMRNGDCKFRSACKFHHPQNWHPDTSVCLLSPLGLPLRPGQSVCTYYSRFGICKFGPSCTYDHPMNDVPSQAMTP